MSLMHEVNLTQFRRLAAQDNENGVFRQLIEHIDEQERVIRAISVEKHVLSEKLSRMEGEKCARP